MTKQLEEQLIKERKMIDYYSADYTTELLYQKYTVWMTTNSNEIFIPNYQREFRRDKRQQSRFIESLLLWIPIPPIFLCDFWTSWVFFQRMEVVDGSQRIRTIANFVDNWLKLEWLKTLTKFNNFSFNQFPENIQNLFKRQVIRVFILSEKTTSEARMDIFDRINTSSVILTPSEVRKWAIGWPIYNLLKELSDLPLFKKLCPISKNRFVKEEWTELVLRYFAYSDWFEKYDQRVQEFLDRYMLYMAETYDNVEDKDEFLGKYKNKFNSLLNFVDSNFPNWFMKSWKKTLTSRAYFEAIAVWVQLAMDSMSVEQLKVHEISSRINSKEFENLVKSDAANNRSNFRNRILYVRDKLLWIELN